MRRLLANREIALTLERVRAAGASAEYVSVDIRNAEQVGRVLDEVRARCGPVRALVHAAGVLEDRLILDKTAEQFRRVYDTKVRGFRALMRALPAEDLRYLIVFSSVTARIGNKGQADYAMANEALNKLAAAHAAAPGSARAVRELGPLGRRHGDPAAQARVRPPGGRPAAHRRGHERAHPRNGRRARRAGRSRDRRHGGHAGVIRRPKRPAPPCPSCTSEKSTSAPTRCSPRT